MENEYRDLWHAVEIGGMCDKAIQRKICQLKLKLHEIAVETDAAGIGVDKKLNVRCAVEAYRVLEQRYASS